MTSRLTESTHLTVRRVSARGVEIEPEHPVETAAGTISTVPLVLVDLRTDQGVTGSSYVRCYTPLVLRATVRLIEDISAEIAGAPADPDALDRRLRARFRLLGLPGLVGIALAALEMATWDACARAAGVTVVELLGGRPRPVPAYASLRSMHPEAAARDAAEAAGQGFGGVKLKLGGGSLEDDLAAIRAVRGAIGADVELMVDYNQSLSVEEALARLPALDAEGLTWIEEPTCARDDRGHAWIAAAARTPVAIGENWWGPGDAERSAAAGACDQAILDVMRVGGVRAWLRAAELLAQADLAVSSHTFAELSVQLLALTPTGHRLEYLDHAGPILAEPIRVSEGLAYPPDRPGSGLEWDEEQVRRWLVT